MNASLLCIRLLFIVSQHPSASSSSPMISFTLIIKRVIIHIMYIRLILMNNLLEQGTFQQLKHLGMHKHVGMSGNSQHTE